MKCRIKSKIHIGSTAKSLLAAAVLTYLPGYAGRVFTS